MFFHLTSYFLFHVASTVIGVGRLHFFFRILLIETILEEAKALPLPVNQYLTREDIGGRNEVDNIHPQLYGNAILILIPLEAIATNAILFS